MNKTEQRYTILLEEILKDKAGISDKLIKNSQELLLCMEQENQDVRKTIAASLYQKIEGDIFYKIWLFSMVTKISSSADWVAELLKMILESEELHWQKLYFLYEQINTKIFMDSNLDTKENVYLRWKLLEKAYMACRQEVQISLEKIPAQQRNSNMAVVLVEQFLTHEHGPTKTVLDRCHTLKTVMGKQVLMINTAELMTTVGQIPFAGALTGMYLDSQLEAETQDWKGEAIPYFQCENDMPNLQTMEVLLQTIYQLKPAIAVCVGGSSLFAGLLNELVPVLTVGTTTSGLVPTLADYQIVNHQFIEDNLNTIYRMDKPASHFIEGNFTFSLKQQKEFVTRQELGIPEHAFVIGIVGFRLDSEISEEMIALFERIVGEDVIIFLIGNYYIYEQCMEQHPSLRKFVYYKGYCEDVLSRIELCDLYLNPLRKGGGTSAVEAMFKGKPVLTISYGDVAGIVGENFCCTDYEEMEQQIKHYYTNQEYYESQAIKAKEIADKYLDTEREFKRIINEYLLREEK